MTNLVLKNRIIRKVFYFGVIASVSMFLITAMLLRDAYGTYQNSRVMHSQDVRSAFKSLDNYEWLAENARIYTGLIDNGFVGVRDNLDWVDFLAPLGENISISDYQFEIGAFTSLAMGENLLLRRADISIYGNVLHDGVLADFLNVVAVNAPGAWFFNSMEVTRNGKPNGLAEHGVSDEVGVLSVGLKLVWVVISKAGANGVET